MISRLSIVAFLVNALGSAVYAQGAGEAAKDVEAALAAAKASFREPSEERLSTARRQLESAIAYLERDLKGDPNAPPFKKYLRWDDMRTLLDAGDELTPADLRRVAVQYFSDFERLGKPQYVAVGNRLRLYANALEASQKDLKEEYGATVDEVAKLLAAYQTAPDEAAAAKIAGDLKFLVRHGEPTDLLTAVHKHYSQPNIFVHADEALVLHKVDRKVNEQTPVNEVILGTRIRGNGHTNGWLLAELRPNSERAEVALMLHGVTQSRTVGSNRSARIYSTGTTKISGFKRVTIEERGIVSTASTADAQMNNQITGIGSTRRCLMGRIVRRVASKRVAQSKGQATAIATVRAEARIRDRLDREAAKQLASSNDDYQHKCRDPLKRCQTYPQLLRYSSTDDDLNAVALEANAFQLGAPTGPPALSGDHALVVVAHESVVNNAASTMFSGRKMLDTEIEAEIERRELTDEIQAEENRDPWSITFADERPIHFQIANGGFSVLLEFREFISGNRQIKKVNVSAKYKAEVFKPKPDSEESRLVFIRQGDIEVDRKQGFKGLEVALKTVLRKKFSKLFKERIEGKGLKFPGDRYEQLGELPLGDYFMENGWAAMGWDMPTQRVARKD